MPDSLADRIRGLKDNEDCFDEYGQGRDDGLEIAAKLSEERAALRGSAWIDVPDDERGIIRCAACGFGWAIEHYDGNNEASWTCPNCGAVRITDDEWQVPSSIANSAPQAGVEGLAEIIGQAILWQTDGGRSIEEYEDYSWGEEDPDFRRGCEAAARAALNAIGGTEAAAKLAKEAQPLPVVDRQCHCQMCEERTKATYRVVARCYNCGQRMIEVYRVGDTVGSGRQCPTCGVVYRVYTDGAATAALREGTTDD